MTRPRKTLSIEGSTAAESGSTLDLAGRTTVTVFVTSDDPTGIEVQVTGSLDGTNFAPITSNPPGGQILTLAESDFANGAAMAVNHHIAAEEVRAEITTAPTGSTDVWLAASALPNAGYEFREV